MAGPLLHSGQVIDDPRVVTELFVEAFLSDVPEPPQRSLLSQQRENKMGEIRVQRASAQRVLVSLDTCSLAGQDDIHVMLLKSCARILYLSIVTKGCSPSIDILEAVAVWCSP